ncbi:oxidoreductase [Rhypophila decipiens]
MGFADKLKGKKIAIIGGSSGQAHPPGTPLSPQADHITTYDPLSYHEEHSTNSQVYRIGYGAAQIILEAGANVTIISSSQEKVNSAVERLQSTLSQSAEGKVNINGAVGDVRNEASFTELLVSLAPLDHIVFSSVDKIIRGPLAEADLDEAKYLFGVKFWGSVVVAKAIAKHHILSSGGSLTLTSGAAAIRPKKNATIGSALNAGVITLTAALADELAAKKIRVNTVIPGLVKTELWDKLGHSAEKQAEIFENGQQSLPVGFVATPEDIAEAYLFFVRADYSTGGVVVIDGGGSL